MSEAGSQGQPDEAMVDLLVKQVTEGLSPAEQRALDVMDSAVASDYRRDLERAAAAVCLAAAPGGGADLPPALRLGLEQRAQEYVAGGSTVRRLSPREPVAAPALAARPAPPRRGAGLGWLAAAACLILAVVGWMRQPHESVPAVVTVAEAPPPAPPVPAPPPSLPEQRAALVAKADTLKIPLGPTKDPAAAGVTGDVVWDPATQTGFLRFVGLAPNDPERHQYQLWIFDGERDKRYPVDGGVFNVSPNSAEVVIPIHAALTVHKAAAFAVTIEKPGGVVVSSRDHVVALGAAG